MESSLLPCRWGLFQKIQKCSQKLPFFRVWLKITQPPQFIDQGGHRTEAVMRLRVLHKPHKLRPRILALIGVLASLKSLKVWRLWLLWKGLLSCKLLSAPASGSNFRKTLQDCTLSSLCYNISYSMEGNPTMLAYTARTVNNNYTPIEFFFHDWDNQCRILLSTCTWCK